MQSRTAGDGVGVAAASASDGEAEIVPDAVSVDDTDVDGVGVSDAATGGAPGVADGDTVPVVDSEGVIETVPDAESVPLGVADVDIDGVGVSDAATGGVVDGEGVVDTVPVVDSEGVIEMVPDAESVPLGVADVDVDGVGVSDAATGGAPGVVDGEMNICVAGSSVTAVTFVLATNARRDTPGGSRHAFDCTTATIAGKEILAAERVDSADCRGGGGGELMG